MLCVMVEGWLLFCDIHGSSVTATVGYSSFLAGQAHFWREYCNFGADNKEIWREEIATARHLLPGWVSVWDFWQVECAGNDRFSKVTQKGNSTTLRGELVQQYEINSNKRNTFKFKKQRNDGQLMLTFDCIRLHVLIVTLRRDRLIFHYSSYPSYPPKQWHHNMGRA